MLNKKGFIQSNSDRAGFTLVELLVVVGIIGFLATIGTISLNSAREKARDAKRISDVKQMSTFLEAEEASNPDIALTGCATAYALTSSCNGVFAEIAKLADPKAVATTPCIGVKGVASTDKCNYSISQADGDAAATTSDYQICFYLESGGAALAKGLNSIINGGKPTAGCN